MKIERGLTSLISPLASTPTLNQIPDLASKDYSPLNIFNPRGSGLQVIENDIQINTYKEDVIIELSSDSSKFQSLYFCILAKLYLPSPPIFMKTLFITQEGKVYTLGKYMYNPKIRFIQGFDLFVHTLQKLILGKMEEYEIRAHGKIQFVLVFPKTPYINLSKFEVAWPFPIGIVEEEKVRGEKA